MKSGLLALLLVCMMQTPSEKAFDLYIRFSELSRPHALKELQDDLTRLGREKIPPAEKKAKRDAIQAEVAAVKAGTKFCSLPMQYPAENGAIGTMPGLKVQQIVNANTVLGELQFQYKGKVDVLVTGVSTDGIADGQVAYFSTPMVVNGTTSFTTVLGATRTVKKLDPMPVDKIEDEMQRRVEAEREKRANRAKAKS